MASYTEPIKTRTISKKMNTYYQGAGTGAGNSSTSTYTNTTTIVKETKFKAIAGENIPTGSAVYVASDKKVYLASSKSSDNKTASAVALHQAVAGFDIEISNDGVIEVPYADFTINQLIFVRNDSILNISQNLLTDATADEDTVQSVGRAVSASAFVIEVSEPLILE